MDKTETSVMQKNPSDLGVLPFYFIKVWPKEVDPKSRIKEAVKLFEEMDKQHFIMSEKIKRKLFEWKQEVSKLDDLKYCHRKILRKIQIQTIMLENLNLELHNLSSASETHRTTKSECTTERGADIHWFNFLMLHQTKKLAEENKLLRDMKFRQKGKVEACNEEMKISTEAERMSTNSITSKGKALNPMISNKSTKKKIKGVCDELITMKEEKKTVEVKIKKAEKISGAIRKEIRSWAEQSKDKPHSNEAYFCMLDRLERIYNEESWVLQYRNLESDQFSCMIYMDKSSSRWTGSCRNWILSNNIDCL